MDTEIVSHYSGNVLPAKTVFPAKFMPYSILLVASKFAHSCGVFLSYDILKLLHVVHFLFFVNLGAAVCFTLVQKPLSGRKISKRQWFRIVRHAFIGIVINLLWLFALTLCGPLRTLLMYEHSDHIVIAVACALFTHNSSPSRFRGAILFVVAFFGIMLFDHDLDRRPDTGGTSDHSNQQHHESLISHIFNHITNLTGLSDHKGGALLLLVTLCMNVGYNTASKKLSLDIGGAKRLNALSTLMSAILLLPWAVVIFHTNESLVESWSSLVIPLGIVTIVVMVTDYYIESACVSHLDVGLTGQIGTTAVLASAVILSAVWTHPFVSQVATILDMNQLITIDHEISAGVVISAVLFALATHSLSQPLRGSSRGTLVGYSAAGPPLYSFAGEALQRTSQSLITVARNGLRQIIEESDSRRIFYFLCINLCFTFVELVYGAWTNSLGLISDGFHMLFDCSALVMGLYAAVMSHWKATRTFSFGYDRVEVLSGFINGLFLMVIAFFVFTAAVTRLFDPPTIKTERLLFVSVGGFCVNMIGIFAFHHNHSHGGGGDGSHGHSHAPPSTQHHGHSHGAAPSHGHSHGSGHGHSHGSPSGGGGGHSHSCASSNPPQNSQPHNTNMEGVFLHVLADTLGSVGVIISTLLIQSFGWNIADPICSLFIATLIFFSVLPLVRETALVLLLRTPLELQRPLATIFHKLLSIDGVVSYSEEHFWRHSSRVLCGTIHVQVDPDASEQKIVAQVTTLFKEAGVNNICVQVEKRVYVHHLMGLGVSVDRIPAVTGAFKTSNSETKTAAEFISDL